MGKQLPYMAQEFCISQLISFSQVIFCAETIMTPLKCHELSNWSFPFVVQSLSRVLLFATPWTAARQASLSFSISWNLLKLMSIE